MVVGAVRSNFSDDLQPVMKDGFVQKAMFRILHFPVGPQTAFYTSSPEMYIFGILDVVVSLFAVVVHSSLYGSIHSSFIAFAYSVAVLRVFTTVFT